MRQIRLQIVTAFACVCVLVCTAEVAARTWTAKNGETTTGKFVRVYNGQVVLSRGGRVVTFPLENFCDADQDYIRKKAGLPALDRAPGKGSGEGDDASGPNRPVFPVGPGYGSPGGSGGSAFPGSPPTTRETGKSPENGASTGNPELDFITERTWTDVQGRKIRAKLIPGDDISGNVTLLKDGKTFNIPRERLSPEDITYVDEMQERIERLRREVGTRTKHPPEGSIAGGPSTGASEPKSPFPTWKPPGYGSNHSDGASPAPSAPAPSAPTPANSDPPNAPAAQPEPAKSSPWPTGTPPPRRGSGSHGRPSFAPSSSPTIPTTPTFPQVETEVYTCSNCGKILPDDIGAGDRCPFCGVYFQYEEGADGKRTYAPGYWISSVVGVLFVLGGIAFRIMRTVS